MICGVRGLAFGGGLDGLPLYLDQPGATLPVQFDAGDYAANGVLGVLLFHHHNGAGTRAEILPVVTAGDTDADGIADREEGADDADGDRIPNLIDIDADGDGLSDLDEGTADPDGDGTPNYLDLDSDDDGLPDADEVQLHGSDPYLADTDGDGIDDAAEVAAGTDPAQAQLPAAPGNVVASDGTVAGAVRIDWDGVPGRVEYRVLRAESDDPEAVTHRSPWLTVTSFDDTGALATVVVPGKGCRAPETRRVVYHYWVQARNPGGEGPLSTPDTGFRGEDTTEKRAGWGGPVEGLLLGLALWLGGPADFAAHTGVGR
ncbi:MAG: fibronectin type III domain-containing protein [Bacteroidales bacterium]|nr:fibronectin type III domain-containing protein [Bacteroidales bacterium]